MQLDFVAGPGHPCLFAALYVSRCLFDIIRPTCLLSYLVCSTLRALFVFGLMFTESGICCVLFAVSEEEAAPLLLQKLNQTANHGVLNVITWG